MKFLNVLKNNIDFLLILGIGIFLRLKDIVKYDLWFDEAYTGLMMKVPSEIFFQELAKDPHPPLYYYLNRGLTQIIGVSDLSLRIIPVLAGIGTIILAYLALKKLLNKEAGLIGAFLISINPFLIAYSIEARSYSFYGFLALLAYTALIYRKNLLFFVATIALAFTHYIGILYAVPLIAIFLYRNKDNKANIVQNVPQLAITILLIGFTAYRALSHTMTEAWWVPKASLYNLVNSVGAYLFGVKAKIPGVSPLNDIGVWFPTATWGIIGTVVLVIALAYFFYVSRTPQKNTLQKDLEKLGILAMLYIGPQMIIIMYDWIFSRSLYMERYLLPSAIFFVIFVTYYLVKSLHFEAMILIVVLYALLLTSIRPPDYQAGMKDLAANLRDLEQELVLTSPAEFVIAQYYMYDKQEILRLYNPEEPENNYVGWPFIYEDKTPLEPDAAFFVSPFETRMAEDQFTKVVTEYSFGDYYLFQKRLSN